MRILSALTAFICLACAANAQTINVRSGAHDGFARLVLDTAIERDWSLQPTRNGARITIADHNGGFDVSRVFERIDTSFISSVSADTGSISLAFSCDCTADVFRQGARMIVIDVSETAVTDAAAPVKAPDRFVGSAPLRFQLRDAPTPVTSRTTSPLPLTTREADAVPAEVQLPLLAPRTPVMDRGEDGIARLQQAQQKISEQIGNAATRGILRTTPGTMNLPLGNQSPQIDTTIFDSSAGETQVSIGAKPIGGNVRVTSSSDIPFVENLSTSPSTTLGVRCIDPARVAVASWAPESNFTTQIARMRGDLYTEFDRLDKEVAVQLARTYLYFGFGAEAHQVLLLDDALMDQQPELASLARIMEFGDERDTEFLAHFVDCDSDLALWAVLAQKKIDPARSIDSDAALRALTGLPMHLRKFVASELSRRFLDYGDERAAASALRSLERTDQPLTPAANLAKAKLEIRQGDVERAQERLADVVSSNAEQSAEALIAFVDSQLNETGQIGQDVATLVEAYAHEMRDDPLGDQLSRTHVLALGKSNQFDKAFETLARIRSRAEAPEEDNLRSSVLDLMTSNADEMVFLRHSFEQMSNAPGSILPKTRYRMARRLVDLGFDGQAERIMTAQDDIPRTTDERLLRAEIALNLSRPYEAIALLYGEAGEPANRLRARAKERAGDFDAAHVLFSEIGDAENGNRAAWLSEDWINRVDETGTVFAPVAQVAQMTLDPSTSLEGMLSRASEALTESAQARETLEALLADPSLDDTQLETR